MPNNLDKERQNASFVVRQLTYLLDGGEDATLLKEKIMLSLERDPIMKVQDFNDLTLMQVRERTMAKVRRMAYYITNESVAVSQVRMAMLSLVDPGAWTRIGVHYGLFFNTLRGQATSQQFAYWASKGAVSLNGIIGCFAMTEIGHGSNVAGLETTATYDIDSDEFVIHTPSLTATKWWIGGAAQSATHSTVYCQLIVKGKRFGVKPFMVQLRDTRTFRLQPGVVIGDCGSKMGRHGTDNGWIQFTDVRIPRSFMLMKHTKVLRNGTVIEPPLQQLAYGSLIQGRVAMVVDSGNSSKKALSIAVRYAAIRRQFGTGQDGQETKILDYVIHQHRLIPRIAQTFAMHFCGVEVNALYEALMADMENLKAGDANTAFVLEQLRDVHGTAAGLKAFCTWMCLDIIDECRQSCGGHGYSAYTGLASLYSDFAVQCTWEGDNNILTLQAGRYLISCYRDAKAGKKLPNGVAYLNNMEKSLGQKCVATTSEGVCTLSTIAEAFNYVVANVVKKAGLDFEAKLKEGASEEQSYEDCSASRLEAAKLHSYGYLFHRFHDAVKKAPAELASILSSLCLLYGLHTIQNEAAWFLAYQYFDARQINWIRAKVTVLCKTIRQDAIPLIDSFNLSDYIINSPLGRYDGQVYENYFALVNAAHPPALVPTYFEKEIYPLLHRNLTEDEPLELDDE